MVIAKAIETTGCTIHPDQLRKTEHSSLSPAREDGRYALIHTYEQWRTGTKISVR
jgi:hypothetical protein